MFNGGLTVPPAMASLLSQDGYIDLPRHGQRLREMYRAESLHFEPRALSPFALTVFCGNLALVEETFAHGLAPDLSRTETPFKIGYASMAVLGSQRVSGDIPRSLRHLEILRLLCGKGLPVDLEDIMGFTALHHATAAPNASEDFTRCLLQHGANVNHRNRFGEISLLGCMQLDLVPIISILLEHGVDLDIPDADGVTARHHYLYCGPRVIAVVADSIRKRSGVVAPRTDKCCDTCAVRGVKLKICGRCKVARYCSQKCQAAARPVHKSECTAFSPYTTVTVEPFYETFGRTMPVADYTRRLFGYPTSDASFSERHTRTSHVPRGLRNGPKVLVVKVQVPALGEGGMGDLLIYTKRRAFACTIRRVDNSHEYDRLSAAVRNHGIAGVKAYFMAELESRDKLVVKISDVLVEQPW
ncbi:hypothetical protein C8F04DRAFT_1291468 [Mycena alexandri]|uniref:MYND-type domain-containing protein n=1 Tax=Mycena alexandri TaxID=1745969 RepID=A0AAD6SJA2_9AGAR|nr:hypothetical protein C8F04DRAFT_1291468 [Mycena alexandri]